MSEQNESQVRPGQSPRQKVLLSRVVKKIVAWSALVAVVAAVVLYFLKTASDARYFSGYDTNLPLEAKVIEEGDTEFGYREKVEFQGLPGERIPALFHYPKDATGPVPCLTLLYGIGQKVKFADDIARSYVEAGYALFCFEQLAQGEREVEDKLPRNNTLVLRRRGRQTVLEARRCLDYLATRPEIDSDRVTLFGVSLGAILGTSALALEPRFDNGILMWGGGDMPRLFTESEVAKGALNVFTRPIALAGVWMLSPAEPLLRIADVAPRPLLFQNALHDEIIPKQCTEAYYERAGDPKEILWYDCGHEENLTEELVLEIVADQIDWLDEGYGIIRSATSAALTD